VGQWNYVLVSWSLTSLFSTNYVLDGGPDWLAAKAVKCHIKFSQWKILHVMQPLVKNSLITYYIILQHWQFQAFAEDTVWMVLEHPLH